MTHPFVGIGHLPEKQFLPPVARPEPKGPANSNSNDDFNPSAADFMAGMVEFAAEQAIRELFAFKGPERASRHVAKIIEDLGWR